MNGIQIFVFIFIMWLMIIGGGGLLVSVIAPISISGSDAFAHFLDSGIKALIAILLVIAWIFIMSKIKNWIFQKQIKH
jgi:hypothetical protein